MLVPDIVSPGDCSGVGWFCIGGGPEATFARALGLDPVRHSYVGAFVLGTVEVSDEGTTHG
jgi:hypothetical protein